MTATIRVDRLNGKTVYVVYPGALPPIVFDYLSAAKIYCAVEGYDWRVEE
jgi:hypothetical protein